MSKGEIYRGASKFKSTVKIYPCNETAVQLNRIKDWSKSVSLSLFIAGTIHMSTLSIFTLVMFILSIKFSLN